MFPREGSLVIPARNPFYLDPAGNPSIDNRSFLWPPECLGVIVHIDMSLLGNRKDPWVTVYMNNMFGHCLLSEIKIIQEVCESEH